MIELQNLSVRPTEFDPPMFGYRMMLSEGFIGVTRISNEIRIKGSNLTFFQASPCTDSSWCVEFICKGQPEEMEMLRKRLYRIPTVVRIHCWHIATFPI